MSSKLFFWRKRKTKEPYPCVTIRILSGTISKERLAEINDESLDEYGDNAAEVSARPKKNDCEYLELPKWFTD